MMDEKGLRDGQRLPADFEAPAWIRAAVRAALLQNFAVSDRRADARNSVYLLELIYARHKEHPDPATAREALHAGVVALQLRGSAALRQPPPSMLTATDLQEILERGELGAHPLTRHLATHWLARMGQSTVGGVASVQVLPEAFERGEWKRFNRLHQHLPLRRLPDTRQLQAVLDREFPWLHQITETIVRELRLSGNLGLNALRLRPLLLVGPPGTGKSRYSRRLAELLTLPHMTVACAGSADSMSIRGTSRGWTSSRPGVILDLLQRHGSAQALVLWDELDKASPSAHNGRIWDACLQLLERETAHRYFDEALEVHCDLSWVSHVATANALGPLPRPLLERFQVMHAPQPMPEHFTALLAGVLDDLAREYRLVDRRLLPALDRQAHHTLRKACGLNPRLLARAVHRLLADQISTNTATLH
jgi:hypothetical protein